MDTFYFGRLFFLAFGRISYKMRGTKNKNSILKLVALK